MDVDDHIKLAAVSPHEPHGVRVDAVTSAAAHDTESVAVYLGRAAGKRGGKEGDLVASFGHHGGGTLGKNLGPSRFGMVKVSPGENRDA